MSTTPPRRSRIAIAIAAAVGLVLPAAGASAQTAEPDPREGLGGGYQDAETAIWNMEHLANRERPPGFINPNNLGDFAYVNSDMAFSGHHAFVGSYAGVQIWDISNPRSPSLRTAVACPGGQGDVSVNGNLMFVSVQQLGTVDCQPLASGGEELRGVRVFDISDITSPVQVAAVQTCRGSHTHTVVEDLDDPGNVYVYVNGTSGVRGDSPEGLECHVGPTVEVNGRTVPSSNPEDFDADTLTDRYQIEVIQVPVANPEQAEIVNEPRLFADEETGNPVGLRGQTDACHDITAYPEIGLAAGACEGNGLLIDITDPANPVRVDAVEDTEHFAYWHSATFNNDGTTVVFTDELGGGVAPTCVPTVDENDGANAIFEIHDTADGPRMEFASYYKIPNNQTMQENCVAHNGNLLPVPGRDIKVQAWYQGGISVMDFTDPHEPFEIAFFDRGPLDEDQLVLSGFWSAYYYNGYIYGSEIARGLDVLELIPSEYLSEEELAQAAAVRLREHTAQSQTMITDADRSACAGVDPVTFGDTAGVHAAAVGCVAGYGIAQGYENGNFGFGANVRRDQMAAFVARTLETAGVELPASPPDAFNDDDGTRHEESINQLAELGVVAGTTETTFTPGAPVTRAQTAALVVRAVELILDEDLAAPRSPFTDVSSANRHVRDIDAAHAAGLVYGTTRTTFAPGQPVQRGQMGSILARALELFHYELVELTPRS
ncbi:S-layer homology domain-containing protein [Egicoccus halophilus]|nr:S-layer homology domain-containing protein [Egicoccus halophilus]